MINIQKIRVLVRFTVVFNALMIGYCSEAQQIEIHTEQGSMVFEMTEFQGFIKNQVITAFGSNTNDSISLSGAVPQYMASIQTALPAVPVGDTITLEPTGPHYRGVITAPIDVDLKGNRTVRLDRLMLVHGKTYTPAEVKTVYASFTEATKKELFVRLYDTVIKYRFTPLADTLKDRYGRPMRVKIKRESNPLLDSLSTRFAVPAFTEGEIAGYETNQGLPGLDGKYLVIAVLKEGEENFNRMMKETVNRKTRLHWKLISR